MYPSYVTVYDGQMYFRGSLRSDGPVTGLWRSNGVTAERIASVGPGGTVKDPTDLAVSNNKLYFAATAITSGATQLWQYDTYAGASPAPGASASKPSLPQELTGYNGNLYFRAARFGSPSNIGIELWKFDGTNQTPIDIYTGSGSSYPQHFIEWGGQLYFNAGGPGQGGSQLWRTNGTACAPLAVIPDNGYSPEQFAVFQDRLYFSAYDPIHGRELFRYKASDNTVALKADIVAGSNSSNPSSLCVYNDKLYFSASDDVHGYELWRYDGSTAQMVAEINPTPDPGNGDTFLMDSSPAHLTVFNGILYFSANDGVHGTELWSYDGANVSMVADINPGQYGSDPSEFRIFSDQLYFSADDGYNPALRGLEPRAFALASVRVNHWTGGTSDWGMPSNWGVGGVPSGPGMRVVLGENGGQTTVDLGADNRTVGSLTLAPGMGMTIQSTEGKSLVLDNGADEASIVAAGNQAFTAPLLLSSNSKVTVSGTEDRLTLEGSIDGNHMLTKDGQGTLVLRGVNGYGGTTVQDGLLKIEAPEALPAGKTLSIAEGGSVVLASGLTLPQEPSGSGPAAVPEPDSLLLLLAAALAGAAIGRARRRQVA